MMIDIFQIIFGVVLIIIMAKGCWISSQILSERSQLRKFTGAYYDFEINEELKERGLTRQEALDIINGDNV
jgi:hypothetical protein